VIRAICLCVVMLCAPPLPGWAEMRILVLGDSNTWGFNASGPRHGETVRWGRVLDAALPHAVVVEEGRIGRRTDLSAGRPLDSIGRAVTTPLPDLAARHLPLDLAVVMLGTNDLQNGQGRNADTIARSAFALARILQAGGIEQVLVVTPPPLTNPERGGLSYIFEGSQPGSEALSNAYTRQSRQTGIPVFDAGSVIRADGVDGVHLTAAAQQKLGRALVPFVAEFLPQYPFEK
jgi:lysophospholipase L1-like esterase